MEMGSLKNHNLKKILHTYKNIITIGDPFETDTF
jgi:hypothetical protein